MRIPTIATLRNGFCDLPRKPLSGLYTESDRLPFRHVGKGYEA